MRLVKTPAAKPRPSSRPWSRLCDDVSIATCVPPRATSSASVAWRSIGPGVVSEPAVESTGAPCPSNAPSVPMLPALSAALNRWRMSAGGGGLAVGAGDADQREPAARMAVPGLAERERGAPAVAHDDLGDARLLRGLDHDGDGAAAHRVGDEAVAVGLRAAHGDVERAGTRRCGCPCRSPVGAGPSAGAPTRRSCAAKLVEQVAPGQCMSIAAIVTRDRSSLGRRTHDGRARPRACSPAAGIVRTTRPSPRRFTRNPRRCSASAASRIERPATSGTGRGAPARAAAPGTAA